MTFSDKIIDWYLLNKRELPWRNTDNPYYIWLSEIILQQTRVIQGMEYYYTFIDKYPTIINLADASEEEVLKTWQGLGYYTRARNLHATANIIKNQYNGVFPDKYENILNLKGIGKYTAAAISSFSFKLPYPVVDGNVFRFFSRLKGMYTPINTNKAYDEFYTLLEKLIDYSKPDLFNHAIMEFGAMMCKPKNPLCESCIFNNECYALKNNKIQELPIKIKLKSPKQRYFYFVVLKLEMDNQKFTLLRKRTENDIWKNLYEFPYIESAEKLDKIKLDLLLKEFLVTYGVFQYEVIDSKREAKHQLTHQTINAVFMEIFTTNIPLEQKNHVICPVYSAYDYPVSILIDRYLKN